MPSSSTPPTEGVSEEPSCSTAHVPSRQKTSRRCSHEIRIDKVRIKKALTLEELKELVDSLIKNTKTKTALLKKIRRTVPGVVRLGRLQRALRTTETVDQLFKDVRELEGYVVGKEPDQAEDNANASAEESDSAVDANEVDANEVDPNEVDANDADANDVDPVPIDPTRVIPKTEIVDPDEDETANQSVANRPHALDDGQLLIEDINHQNACQEKLPKLVAIRVERSASTNESIPRLVDLNRPEGTALRRQLRAIQNMRDRRDLVSGTRSVCIFAVVDGEDGYCWTVPLQAYLDRSTSELDPRLRCFKSSTDAPLGEFKDFLSTNMDEKGLATKGTDNYEYLTVNQLSELYQREFQKNRHILKMSKRVSFYSEVLQMKIPNPYYDPMREQEVQEVQYNVHRRSIDRHVRFASGYSWRKTPLSVQLNQPLISTPTFTNSSVSNSNGCSSTPQSSSVVRTMEAFFDQLPRVSSVETPRRSRTGINSRSRFRDPYWNARKNMVKAIEMAQERTMKLCSTWRPSSPRALTAAFGQDAFNSKGILHGLLSNIFMAYQSPRRSLARRSMSAEPQAAQPVSQPTEEPEEREQTEEPVNVSDSNDRDDSPEPEGPRNPEGSPVPEHHERPEEPERRDDAEGPEAPDNSRRPDESDDSETSVEPSNEPEDSVAPIIFSEDVLLGPTDEPEQAIVDEDLLLSEDLETERVAESTPSEDAVRLEVEIDTVSSSTHQAVSEIPIAVASSSKPMSDHENTPEPADLSQPAKYEICLQRADSPVTEKEPTPSADPVVPVSAELTPVPAVSKVSGARRRKQGLVRRKDEALENANMEREWEEISTLHRRRASLPSTSAESVAPVNVLEEIEPSVGDEHLERVSQSPAPVEESQPAIEIEEPLAKKPKVNITPIKAEVPEAAKRVLRSTVSSLPKPQTGGRRRKSINTPKSRVQPKRGIKKTESDDEREDGDVPEERLPSTSSNFRADSVSSQRMANSFGSFDADSMMDRSSSLNSGTLAIDEAAIAPSTEADLLGDSEENRRYRLTSSEQRYTAEQLLGDIDDVPLAVRPEEPVAQVPEQQVEPPKKKKGRPPKKVKPEPRTSPDKGAGAAGVVSDAPGPSTRKRTRRSAIVDAPLVKLAPRKKRNCLSTNNPVFRHLKVEENPIPVRLTGVAERDVPEPEDTQDDDDLALFPMIRRMEHIPGPAEIASNLMNAQTVIEHDYSRPIQVKTEEPDEAPTEFRKSKKRLRLEQEQAIMNIKQEEGVVMSDAELQVVMTKIAMKREMIEEQEEVMIVQANYMCPRNAVDEEPETSLPKTIRSPEEGLTNADLIMKRILEGINQHFMSDPERFCAISLILETDTERMGRVFKASAEVVNRTSEFSQEFIEYLAKSPRTLNYLNLPSTDYNNFSNALRERTSLLLANHKITPLILYEVVEKIGTFKKDFRNSCTMVGGMTDNERDALAATERILIGRYIDSVMKLTGLSQLTWATEGHVKRRLELIYYGWTMFLASGGFLKVFLALNRPDVKKISEQFRTYTSKYIEDIEANYRKAINFYTMSEAELFEMIRTEADLSENELTVIDADIHGRDNDNKCTKCSLSSGTKASFTSPDNLDLHFKLHLPSTECGTCFEDLDEHEMVLHRINVHCSLSGDDSAFKP